MSDVVVTVPKNFTHPCAPGKRGLAAWLAEGDAPGTEWTGTEWDFTTYGPLPMFIPGDRAVGYAPLLRILYEKARFRNGCAPLCFVRGGGAVACTIYQEIRGFRGWRSRWWERSEEKPLDLSDYLTGRPTHDARARSG